MTNGISQQQLEMLQTVQEADFVVIEWQLYLDTHPNDLEAVSKWREATKWSKHVRNEYEKQFGPLNMHSVPSKELLEAGWRWSQPPWPWQI